MILVAATLLTLALVATVVVFSALRLSATSRLRCGASCGAFIEPYTGVRGGSGDLFCSASCAELHRHPDAVSGS